MATHARARLLAKLPHEGRTAIHWDDMNALGNNRHASTWIVTACGVWLVVLGFYFMLIRPPLLPEDLRYMHTTLAQVRAAIPGLEHWLARVFPVLGGFVAGAGVLTVFVAVVAMPQRLKGTSWTLALAGVLTAGLMSATNFVLDSDFRWLLLVPALVWLTGLVLYIAGRRSNLLRSPRIVGWLKGCRQ